MASGGGVPLRTEVLNEVWCPTLLQWFPGSIDSMHVVNPVAGSRGSVYPGALG